MKKLFLCVLALAGSMAIVGDADAGCGRGRFQGRRVARAAARPVLFQRAYARPDTSGAERFFAPRFRGGSCGPGGCN